ncbi:MAG: Gfo/Idh/MocA family oxidoreductase [Saprospirales bacterium]|jgi:predicted dehydrogenase|nr:Gfo/Idh/MocA family oxidoreductase [Saprospirales bacterium]MBK8922268.1 Gfo/Idh/MocA family oxidoreductase [Saprospirales bacterium]
MAALRIGLLGAGHLGKIHLKCILATAKWRLAGFYDPDHQNATTAIAQYQARRFTSVAALLREVDAVDIVTPTPSHYRLAAQAIRAGKHVFIEKPVTQTLSQGLRLLQLAEQAGVKVQIGHVERFNPAYLALRDMLLQPMFIESHRLAVFQPRGTEVSVILDLMIHDLDLVLHLVGSPVKSVSASGVAVLSQTPDIANARVEFANGCVANLTASRISMKQMRKMRLFQRDAYISLDFLDKTAQIVRLFDQNAQDLPPLDQLMEFETPAAGKKWLHLQMPDATPVNAIQMELETFAESILSDKQTPVPLRDGLEALRLAHRILREIEKRNADVLQKAIV